MRCSYSGALEAVGEGDAAGGNAEGGAGGSEGTHGRHVSRRQVAVLHLLYTHPHTCALAQLAWLASTLITPMSQQPECLLYLQCLKNIGFWRSTFEACSQSRQCVERHDPISCHQLLSKKVEVFQGQCKTGDEEKGHLVEAVPGDFKQHALLRIHELRLGHRDAEEGRVKGVHGGQPAAETRAQHRLALPRSLQVPPVPCLSSAITA